MTKLGDTLINHGDNHVLNITIMKKEENKKQEELNDEQLNQINGGYTEEAISKMKIPPL